MDIGWLEKFNDKKIVILGYGLEGKSTYNLLNRHCKGATLQIMDRNSAYVHQCFEGEAAPFIYDDHQYLQTQGDVDLIFKSPGIPLMQLENHLDLSLVTSQTNEFIAAYREQIVGVTGTKGKSTTVSFLYDLLKAYGVKVDLVGNIGKPAFDRICEASETDLFVYELSSHQLETVQVSPRIGVVLNVFEEHLDHYHSYDHYVAAKLNIGRYQGEDDFLICHGNNEEISHGIKGFKGRQVLIDKYLSQEGIFVQEAMVTVCYGKPLVLDHHVERQVLGHHNLVNMATGILCARILGHENQDLELKTIKNFKGLAHRLAYVKTVKGIAFYNDSISTIPLATLAAIKAIPEVATIIVGGMDRGIDYGVLIEFINTHSGYNWIMLPDSGHLIAQQVVKPSSVYKVASMTEAVAKAVEVTDPGKACLLSPAAASYGFYKNFEARGADFERLVDHL